MRSRLTTCSQPGCPVLVPPACPDHGDPGVRQPGPRKSFSKRGYDRRWQATRTTHLASHPDCDHCGAKATDVHHLDELGPQGPRGHDPSNLQALCHPCHSTQTASSGHRGWTGHHHGQ